MRIIKRIGNLYSQIYDIENLELAHQHAKRGKGWYTEVQIVEAHKGLYLKNLQQQFINHTYKTSKYSKFIKKEGSKERVIYKLPYFPDRIAQWAIIQVIEQHLIKKFIKDTYSSIPGKGLHQALNSVRKAVQNGSENTTYCLKIDIRHFYQNINHEVLKNQYKRIFKDKELIWILSEIINSINTADEEDLKIIYKNKEIDYNTGIPIGNYLSQYSGNIYLYNFDHWIKEDLRIKYYYRYMDDIVILNKDKNELRKILKLISQYLHSNLKLFLKPNYQIFPVNSRGIDFVGYRIFRKYTLLRKTTAKTLKKKCSQIYLKVKQYNLMNYNNWCVINSYKGWTQHCNSFKLNEKYLKPLQPYADYYYHKIIRGESNASLSEYLVNCAT